MDESLRQRTTSLGWGGVAAAILAGVLLISLLGGCGGSVESAGETLAPGVALRVNGEPIDRAVLDEAMADLYAYYRAVSGGNDAYFLGTSGAYFQIRVYYDAMMELIRRRLIEHKAEDARIEIEQDDVDMLYETRFYTLLGQYGLSETEFERQLAASGTTLQEYQEDMRAEVRLEMLTARVQAVVLDEAEIDEDRLREHYVRYLEPEESFREESFQAYREEVRADYAVKHEQEIIRAWYREQLEEMDIAIRWPILRAYFEGQRSLEDGLEMFRDLLESGTIADPSIPYYMARLVEEALASAEARQQDLEGDEEGEAEREALRAEISQLRRRAMDLHLEAITWVAADPAQIGRMRRLKPDPVESELIAGLQSTFEGNAEAAETSFERVIERRPTLLAAYFASARQAESRGAVDEAMDRYEEAREKSGGIPHVTLALVGALTRAHRFDRAEELLEEVRGDAADSVWVRLAEGDLASQAFSERVGFDGDLIGYVLEQDTVVPPSDDARELYECAVEAYEDVLNTSDSLGVRVRLGWLQVIGGDVDEAQPRFEDVLGATPYAADAYEGRAAVAWMNGRRDEAIEDLRMALSFYDAIPPRQRLLEAIVALEPDRVIDRLRLGDLYLASSAWEKAQLQFEGARALEPESIDPHLRLAEARRESGDPDDAIDGLWEGVTAVSTPDHKGRLLQEIVTIAGTLPVPEGDGVHPELRSAQTELALLYGQQGRVDEALEALRALPLTDPAYDREEVVELLRAIDEAHPEALAPEERERFRVP